MRKALVPVDGSAAAHRAVRHIVALAGTQPSIEAVLLNVQPEVDEWRVRRVLKKEEIEAMEESRGGDTLQQDREVLKAAGRPLHCPWSRLARPPKRLPKLPVNRDATGS
jgi:nucleotide-binding universal stress UspA family protein